MKKRRKKKKVQIWRLLVIAGICVAVVMLGVQTVQYLTIPGSKNNDASLCSQASENGTGRYTPSIQVDCILQNPELPTGCEATSGTMLLNAYGYEVKKTETARLLEKSERVTLGDRVYAVHPSEAFIGDPENNTGFGTFPNVLAKALQTVIDRQDGKHKAVPLTGLSQTEILNYIDSGKPVCVWTSSYDREIVQRTGWYLIRDGVYTDEYYEWLSNEHVVVLVSYNEYEVTVCDPLVGVTAYSIESFFRHYEQLGRHALILEEKS